MRRPLVIVAILYVSGLLLAEIVTPSLPALISCAFAFGVLALFWERGRPWLLVPAIILTGWANLTSRTAILSPHDLRSILPIEPSDVAVRGTLMETPGVRMFIRDNEESFRTLAVIEVKGLRRGTNWIPATGRVMTVTPGSLAGAAYAGTPVEVQGVIASPSSPVAPGLFDYRTHLARQGIYFQLKAGSTNAWHALERASPPLADRFLAWAQRTLARGLPEKDEPLRLLFAMTLGWKSALTSEVYEPFMKSGTMHIFAISGLHIALIAGLLVAVLRVLRIPRHWCGVLVIPLIWFYTAATGWQPSAIRSVIMMTVIVGGWSLGRPSDLLNSLAAAGLIILVWQPQQLFQASFQLSFFVVLSIALLTPPLQRFSDRLLNHDPLLPREALPRWRRWLATPLRWLALSLTTSLAAWLGSLPLTAHYFHIFSPVTLLANLAIVPLAGAALASNLGSLLCADWLPWIGECFNHSAWFWMWLMVQFSHWTITLRGAFCYVASPPAWGFVAYYVLLVGSLSGWFFKKENRRWAAVALVLVIAGAGWEWNRARNEFALTILPLNGGHAVFVDGPGTSNDWLVDCGDTNAVEFVTKPFLHAQGVNHLQQLALTHGDVHHIGGARLFWEEMPTSKTYTSPIRFRSPTYRDILTLLESAPDHHGILSPGQTNGCWIILHPEGTDRFSQADDASLVLLGQFHGTRVLLLGDLGRPGQEVLMKRAPDLRADIVVSGLPEETEPLCNGLIEAVRPKLIIIADAEFPATKRAPQRLKERLNLSGVPVAYLRESSAVTITIRAGKWNYSTSATDVR